jgi:biopolymer transport protein ExbB/TolQ
LRDDVPTSGEVHAFMQPLVQTLYMLSTALLLPVVVLLLATAAWTFLQFGGFLAEWRQRRTGSAYRRAALRDPLTTISASPAREGGAMGYFARHVSAEPRTDEALRRIITEIELLAAARIAGLHLGVRLGPLLGLMGTLIPLGPALMGLTDMQIGVIAENLVVAFATTVVGLLIGGLSFLMLTVRRQWYARDVADLEYLVSHLIDSASDAHAIHSPHEENHRPSPSPLVAG